MEGLNIDLDEENIELFRSARPKDYNFNFAISSKEENKKLFYHPKSPINTLEENVSKAQKQKFQIKDIKVTTLNYVLGLTNIKTIDFLNIDVEGHELHVLEGWILIYFFLKSLILSS